MLLLLKVVIVALAAYAVTHDVVPVVRPCLVTVIEPDGSKTCTAPGQSPMPYNAP